MIRVAVVLFLVLATAIAVVFVGVARSTRRSRDIDPAAARRVRAAFFAGLLALLAAFLMLTVTRLPYPVEAAAPDRILHVTAKQYAFALSDAPVPNADCAWASSRRRARGSWWRSSRMVVARSGATPVGAAPSDVPSSRTRGETPCPLLG